MIFLDIFFFLFLSHKNTVFHHDFTVFSILYSISAIFLCFPYYRKFATLVLDPHL